MKMIRCFYLITFLIVAVFGNVKAQAQNFCLDNGIEGVFLSGESDNPCCWSVNIKNSSSDLTKVQLELNDPIMFFDPNSIETDFNLSFYSPELIIVDNEGMSMPIDEDFYQVFTYCFEGITDDVIGEEQPWRVSFFDSNDDFICVRTGWLSINVLCESCETESFPYSLSEETPCCYGLDLNNLDPNLSKIQIDINTPNVFFDQSSITTGYVAAYSPQSISIENGGMPFPTGSIPQYLTFCFGNTGNLVNSQSFTIKYFDFAGNEIADCQQDFEVECALECRDESCIDILPISITCDSFEAGKFRLDYQIHNQTPDKVIDRLDFMVVDSNTGVTFSTENSVAIPPIEPNTTSFEQSLDIYDLDFSFFSKQVEVVVAASGYDVNNSEDFFFCYNPKDTLTLRLPDCCNPCDTTWVAVETIPNMDEECCYNLDILNTCEDRLFAIKVTSLTGGVNLGAHWNPNYSSTWTFNVVNNQVVEWYPIGGYAPAGNFTDLIHFCLDNPLAVSNPQIMVEYLNIDPATGEEIVECEEILDLECEIDINCIDILEHEVRCDSLGNYYLDFCIQNISTPSLIADELQVSKLSSTPSTMGLSQYSWFAPPSFPLNTGGVFCATTQIIGGSLMSGDMMTLEFQLKNFTTETCCIESETLSIVLPECCPPIDPTTDLLLNRYRTAMTCGVDTFPNTPKYTFGVMDNSQVLPVGTRSNFTGNPLVSDYHHPSWHIDSIGNVFGITIDQEGYMYAAASANYGAGFWIYTSLLQYGKIGGDTNDLAAAGTIYQMDKTTGQARVFAQLPQQSFNFTHENCEGIQTFNRFTGPGLGNIVYDPTHDQIFAANWEDGKIYRLDMSGSIVDSFDPQEPDNNLPGLPNFNSDVIPYGLAVTKDGTQLFFGTLYSGGQVISINLDPMGGFVGSAATGQIHYRFMQPNISVSDLEFLPNGDLLVGTRSGCNNNFASSYSHGGSTYILTPTGGMYNSISTQLPVSYDSNLPFNFLDGDDQYGGVAFAEYAGYQWEYVVSSSDILDETGPHGIAVIPQNFTGSPISQLAGIAYAPITNNSDMKGIGGDVQVFNPCSPFVKPSKSDCCQSEMDFDNRVNAGFTSTVVVNTTTVTPNNLTDCHTVTWIWGDGTPNGISQGNATTIHTYAGSNNYQLCMVVAEYDTSGDLCWEREFCDVVVSTPSNDATVEFKVYPNPTQSYLIFEWKNVAAKSYQLAIFDLQGQIIWQQLGAATLEQKLELDLKDFPTGMYGYHLQWEGGQAEYGKFIKGL